MKTKTSCHSQEMKCQSCYRCTPEQERLMDWAKSLCPRCKQWMGIVNKRVSAAEKIENVKEEVN